MHRLKLATTVHRLDIPHYNDQQNIKNTADKVKTDE